MDTTIYQGLLEHIKTIPTIDTHEHLPPEEERIRKKIDALYLFSHYNFADLISSGMPVKLWEEIENPEMFLTDRWQKFKPYWERIRYGSYARCVLISIRDLFGFDDLNDDTVEALSLKIQEHNRKGWYKEVLKKRANIVISIQSILRTDVDKTLFVPIMSVNEFLNLQTRDDVNALESKWNIALHSLDDLKRLMKSGISQWKKEGAVGLKISHAYNRILKFDKVAQSDAEKMFNSLLEFRGRLSDKDYKILQDYLMHEVVRSAIDEDLVVAIHTGLQHRGDNVITNANSTHLTNLFMEYKEAKFDVFHGGFPYVEEAGVQGKYFPNVHLNMCWMHIMSPVLSQRALDFWLDVVPVNKIMGFGGDYWIVENVYGHITMARENIARVLEKRIIEGKINEKEAYRIAHLLLHDNPKGIYKLNLPEEA